MGEPIIKFGKYKGLPLTALDLDPGYCAWLASQPWVGGQFPQVFEYVTGKPAPPASRRCAGVTVAGAPCKGWAMGSGEFCGVHEQQGVTG